MSWRAILEDWSEYDTYKKLQGKNAAEFLTDDPWEVAFLINKIRSKYPLFENEQDIQQAIMSCALMISNPRPRLLFVQCVLKQLSLL